MKNSKHARFNTRLPEEQKELFEEAVRLGQYRSLTDFVLSAAQEKAEEIMEAHEQILASEQDRQIFFDAILHPPEPSDALKEAAAEYKNFMHEK